MQLNPILDHINMHLALLEIWLVHFFFCAAQSGLEMWDWRHSGGWIKKGSDEPVREGALFPRRASQLN